MKYELKISYEDYKLAQRLHLRPRRGFRIILYPLLSLFALATIFASIKFVTDTGSDSALLFYSIVGYIACTVAIFFVFIPLKWKRIYKQHKFFETIFDYEFTEASLCSTSELGNVSLPWTKFHKWKENRNMFLVYPSDDMFHLIPKRLFKSEEEVQNIRTILSKSIGTAMT